MQLQTGTVPADFPTDPKCILGVVEGRKGSEEVGVGGGATNSIKHWELAGALTLYSHNN